MELDWTTFILEIINFLVLVWILKRFLYQPVLNVIAQRKAAIDKTLAEAQALQAEAGRLRQQYEHRLADWGNEKEQARRQMLEELAAERTRLMGALQTALQQEREKNQVLEQRRADELRRAAEAQAVTQGARFAARLLARLAAPALEARIVELVLEDLPQLAAEQVQAIRAACRENDVKMNVTSVYPLSAEHRERLVAQLTELSGTQAPCRFREDPGLLAGLRISIGPWVLRANLQDELAFFSEDTRGTR